MMVLEKGDCTLGKINDPRAYRHENEALKPIEKAGSVIFACSASNEEAETCKLLSLWPVILPSVMSTISVINSVSKVKMDKALGMISKASSRLL